MSSACLTLIAIFQLFSRETPKCGAPCAIRPQLSELQPPQPFCFPSIHHASPCLRGFVLAVFSAGNASPFPLDPSPRDQAKGCFSHFPPAHISPRGRWGSSAASCLHSPVGACGCLIHVCLGSCSEHPVKATGHVCLARPTATLCLAHSIPEPHLPGPAPVHTVSSDGPRD